MPREDTSAGSAPSPGGSLCSPTSTRQYEIVLPLEWVSFASESTFPTTSGPVTGGGTICSSSSPTATSAAARVSAVVPGATSTCSASQDSGTYGISVAPSGGAELEGEAHVSLDHVAHVGDAVAQHESAFDAHTEREPGVDVRVDARGAQHVRVDHAAAAPFDPAGSPLLLREPQIHLGAGLGEGEEARAQPGARLGPEHGAGEVVQGALQMRHGQPCVDGEALDLVEDRRVRRVEGVGAEHLAGTRDVQRHAPGEHGAGLHGRGVGAQDEVRVSPGALGRVDVEGVLHLPCRMVHAEVE